MTYSIIPDTSHKTGNSATATFTHPTIYRELTKGHFSVKRSRGNFNKSPSGGIHGISTGILGISTGAILGIST